MDAATHDRNDKNAVPGLRSNNNDGKKHLALIESPEPPKHCVECLNSLSCFILGITLCAI